MAEVKKNKSIKIKYFQLTKKAQTLHTRYKHHVVIESV